MFIIHFKGDNSNKTTWEMLSDLGTSREYSPGELIYYQNEPSAGLVYIEQGRIKCSVFFPDGTEKSLNIIEGPTITGETSVIDGGTTICSVIAVTRVKAFLIPRKKAQELIWEDPNLMILILDCMARKMRSLQIQAQEIVSNIPERLAYLLLHAKEYGVYSYKEHGSRFYITHDELAGFIGTTRPKITEILNIFMKQGFIDKGRGYIEIKDYEGLNRIADH